MNSIGCLTPLLCSARYVGKPRGKLKMLAKNLSPNLRIATANDVAGIACLINEAYLVESFFVDGDRIDETRVRTLQENGFFLVLDGRNQSGKQCIIAAAYAKIDNDRGYFGLLSITPRRQGEGLGRRLVGVLESYFEAEGCTRVDLQVVNLREELPAWYRDMGYREDGVDPFPTNVPTKQPCYFIRMCKELGTSSTIAA